MSPSTSAFPVGAPKVVPAAIGVPPGILAGVMLLYAARKSSVIGCAVIASGLVGVITSPLIDGAEPPQRPKPGLSANVIGTPLHVAVGFNTTFPSIIVLGAVGVLVIPAVAAIPYDEDRPSVTISMAGTAAVIKTQL